jgi:hypothetical protein
MLQRDCTLWHRVCNINTENKIIKPMQTSKKQSSFILVAFLVSFAYLLVILLLDKALI